MPEDIQIHEVEVQKKRIEGLESHIKFLTAYLNGLNKNPVPKPVNQTLNLKGIRAPGRLATFI